MATAIQVLVEEHEAISEVLGAMDATVVHLRAAQHVEGGWFEDVARFHVVYTDGTHHAKEEGVLFKALFANGLSTRSGPIATLLQEHNVGRGLVKHLSRLAGPCALGQRAAVADWSSASLAFTQLLRSHLNKEERVLFPLARELLPPAVLDSLLEQYARIDVVDTKLGEAGAQLITRALAWWPAHVARPRSPG